MIDYTHQNQMSYEQNNMSTGYSRSAPPGLLVSIGALCTAIAPIGSMAEEAVFSPDIHWTEAQTVVADEEAGTADSVLANLFAPGGLPASADVDAAHGLANGDVLFSLESTLELGGVVYRPNDVIRFDGKSWTKELDGRASGIPDGVNIDAITKSAESLLFSVDVGSVLGSVTVSDADIVAYDGGTFSIAVSADDVGIESAADVDALHMDNQGALIMSFETAGQVGGIHYRDEDLLALDDTTWSKEADNSAASWAPVDLDAWSMVFSRNIIFSDGFEQD
jgi:hypothetical protein